MVKKKESKKPSAKEDKQAEDNNNIFDINGKLILDKVEEQQVKQQIDKKKKPTKTKIVSAEEKQELKRAVWRKYYSDHKQQYKQYNKNWRDKQKKKSE